MIRQHHQHLTVSTQRRGFYEITSAVETVVTQSGIRDGLVTVLIRHTSASLLIQENADPTVRNDLETIYSRVAPDGDPVYAHNAEGQDDMSAHARAALTNVTLGIPVIQGALALGTWQGIYLWEHRQHAHNRQVLVHIIGE